MMRLTLALLALARAAMPASAQPAGGQCRAACAAMPREDRGLVLACLRRCGVAVQQPVNGRLTAGSGYGRSLPVRGPAPQGAGRRR